MSNDPLFQGRAEEALKNHERRISNLEVMNENLIRLTTSVEHQVEMNKDQQQVLVKMNENLTGLNSKMENLDMRVEQLESSDSDRRIDLGKLFKELLYKVLPAILIAWIIFYFGWK